MTQLDTQTPEQHRQRYLDLKARARERTASVPTGQELPDITSDDVRARHVIPGGWYWTGFLRAGQILRIADIHGNSTVSALFWNARDTSERYNAGDTVKLQWTARLGAGKVLFSDMGRVLVSITSDTGDAHDTILGGSTSTSNRRRYGDAPLRNTRDNFLLAAGKLGLGRQDVGPCISFFAPVGIDADGNFAWRGAAAAPGRCVDLRAEMDLLVALSNCPHPFDPSPVYHAEPIELIIRRETSIAVEDPCRTCSEEAMRGFENTRSYREALAGEMQNV